MSTGYEGRAHKPKKSHPWKQHQPQNKKEIDKWVEESTANPHVNEVRRKSEVFHKRYGI